MINRLAVALYLCSLNKRKGTLFCAVSPVVVTVVAVVVVAAAHANELVQLSGPLEINGRHPPSGVMKSGRFQRARRAMRDRVPIPSCSSSPPSASFLNNQGKNKRLLRKAGPYLGSLSGTLRLIRPLPLVSGAPPASRGGGGPRRELVKRCWTLYISLVCAQMAAANQRFSGFPRTSLRPKTKGKGENPVIQLRDLYRVRLSLSLSHSLFLLSFLFLDRFVSRSDAMKTFENKTRRASALRYSSSIIASYLNRAAITRAEEK